jgi:hypothetical protein
MPYHSTYSIRPSRLCLAYKTRGQIRYTWHMGILDNLEAAWDDADLELQIQNPHTD